MTYRSRSPRATALGVCMAGISAVLLLGALSGTASAASPPVNTAPPTMSSYSPMVGSTVTASTGAWTSEDPAHWYAESSELKEGESTAVTVHGNPMTFSATVGGAPVQITCNTTLSSGSVKNPTGGGGGFGSANIGYSGCVNEGPEAGCVVTAEAAVPIKVELGSLLSGNAKAVLVPAEGTQLVTLAVTGSKCAIAGSYPVVGVVEGVYSNTLSRVEFSAATSETGALHFVSKKGPKAAAAGSAVFKTTAGASIAAEALTYSYTWESCVGGSCGKIGGATGPSYVPVRGDLGRRLRVAVTATGAGGSTTAGSSETNPVKGILNWYDSGSPITSTPFTSSNVLVGPPEERAENYFIGLNIGGSHLEIVCPEGVGKGTLVNTPSQARIEGYELTLSHCTINIPGCFFESEQIRFPDLVASSVEPSTEVDTELRFGGSGYPVAEFTILGSSCPLYGKHQIIGSFPAHMHNEGSWIRTSETEVEATRELHLDSSKGPIVGIGSALGRILAEGTKPVKLDVEP